MRVAAVFTAHNRKDVSLACLDRLSRETAAEIDVYMLDDGSSDGTGEAVRRLFPRTIVLDGDGSHFWAGGMDLAMRRAMQGDYDFYLWLNDDVALDEGFLARLLECHARQDAPGAPAIVVGPVRDRQGRLAYGGHVRGPSRLRLDFSALPVGEEAQACDTFHGNCVLIPREVVRRIGPIDGGFFHNFADFDYGLRARRAGCTAWQAPGSIGTCEHNEGKRLHARRLRYGRWEERRRAFFDRRCHHMPSRLRYFVRHLGPLGLVAALSTTRYLLPFGGRREPPDKLGNKPDVPRNTTAI